MPAGTIHRSFEPIDLYPFQAILSNQMETTLETFKPRPDPVKPPNTKCDAEPRTKPQSIEAPKPDFKNRPVRPIPKTVPHEYLASPNAFAHC
jgi:hypothetical protein